MHCAGICTDPKIIEIIYSMSLIKRKHVFGCLDQAKHKPFCACSEAALTIDIWNIKSIDWVLSRQQISKALIRLRGCLYHT